MRSSKEIFADFHRLCRNPPRGFRRGSRRLRSVTDAQDIRHIIGELLADPLSEIDLPAIQQEIVERFRIVADHDLLFPSFFPGGTDNTGAAFQPTVQVVLLIAKHFPKLSAQFSCNRRAFGMFFILAVGFDTREQTSRFTE